MTYPKAPSVVLAIFCVFPISISASDQSYDMQAINEFLKGGQSYSIPHASYKIHIPNGISYYTFDGNHIVTVPQPVRYDKEIALLDKTAPNPRPIAFEIRPHEPRGKAIIPLKAVLSKILAFFEYDILFYDKNGNELGRTLYDGPIPATKDSLKKWEVALRRESNIFKLDLSGIVEDKTWLWYQPFTWFKRFKIHNK